MANETLTIADDISPKDRMSYEEFLNWADEDTHAEWVNGVVQFMSPVSRKHQKVGFFLLQLMGRFVEMHEAGELYYESFQMKTGPDLPGREPDLLFVSNEHLGRIENNYLNGPADLVVEIISPESRRRDREEKYREYEQGGVREYWIIDPDREEADFYVVSEEGSYLPVSIDENGRYRSLVLSGLWLEVGWLWQEPLPRSRDILKEWGLVEPGSDA